MPEPRIPFDLYETPEPSPQLTEEIEARVKRIQRAAVVTAAERRQSRKLVIAASAAVMLAVAVIVLLFVMLRDSGSQAAECPIYYAALGGGPSPVVEEKPTPAEFRPASARKLENPGLLRQFDTVRARARAARAIAKARRARVTKTSNAPPPAATFTLNSAGVQAQLDQAKPTLTECYATGADTRAEHALVFALSVAGEPVHGTIVEDLAVSSLGGRAPDAKLVECATQTILSLRFPPPDQGGRVLVAYALRAPELPAETDEALVGASRPRPAPKKATIPKGASPDELVKAARAAAKAGWFQDAIALAERALKREPNNQDALMVAVIASCNLRRAEPAARYIARLKSKGRRSMAGQICKRQLGYDPAEESDAANTCLDEVGCLLADYPPDCCKQYGTIVALTERADIKAGIAAVRDKVSACGKVHPAEGSVKVQIDVSPAGKVSEVRVTETPDEALGTCVAEAVRKAKFRVTRKGGSFTYPFVFR